MLLIFDALKAGKVDGFSISSYKGYTEDNVEFLREVAFQIKVLVMPLAERYNIRVVEELRKLRCLDLRGANQHLDFREMNDLEDLSLEWNKGFHLPTISSSLKQLFLKGYKPKSNDLSELPPYGQLESLSFVQGSFASLSGIERYSKIKKASFAYAPKLEYVHHLTKTKVEDVDFAVCKKLKDLKSLSACPCLVRLKLFKCAELDSLAFLDLFPHLQDFRFVGTKIRDGDMTPLLRMKDVGFLKQRGYSHTPEEIRELIGDTFRPVPSRK